MKEQLEEGPAGGGAALTEEQQPVAILCRDAGHATTLSEALRRRGMRSRRYVNARVMVNAARQTAPGAIVAEQALMRDAVTEACIQSVQETSGAPLLLLTDDTGGPPPDSAAALLDRAADADSVAQQLQAVLFDQGWRRHLDEALRQDRFHLAYQPIHGIDGTATGLHEVLVRMLDPGGRTLLPDTFLPAAARLGRRRQIDRWVIINALDVLAGWDGASKPTLFIKLFPETACTSAFPTWLGRQIRQRALDQSRLVFQLPYPDVSADPAAFRPLGAILHREGCGLALEHYAPEDPAATHWPFPISHVKLASSLTRSLAEDRTRQRHVQAVVSHLHRLDIRVIATRVQDPDVMTGLWHAGVDYVQGYFLQPPDHRLQHPDDQEPAAP
ncbi:MAG: EAL domain-containing protein [Ectothiorhodospiraceae bacterium]|nr:EAL domain-containing protein [Ectothiorhodospiraceae bacterium]